MWRCAMCGHHAVERHGDSASNLVLLWLKVFVREPLATRMEEYPEQLKTITEPLDEVLATRCLGNARDSVT